MLPRQLHRPLLRSVTAAWRPATTISAPFHHGASRSSNGSISSAQQQEDDESPQHEIPSPAPPTPQKPSLLEQLFPDEAKRLHAKSASKTDVSNNEKKSWASHLFNDNANAEPPRLALPEELQAGAEDGEDIVVDDAPGFYHPAMRAKSMLILSAASKNLLESDFLRLGAKGKHVEGWVGGILKVIQARDPDTLEPKGYYFILFDTDEAAAAYKDRAEHLWQLGKAHVPGAHHGRAHMQQQPLPRGLRRTLQGEDVAQLIASFTLVPPSQSLHLTQSRMSPARIAELYAEGGFVDRLAARAGSKFLVLVRLDGGRLTLDTLRRAIEEDGNARHLAWRVTDLEKGILPFGKSILKAKDRVHDAPRAENDVDDGTSDTRKGLSAQDVENEDGASTNASPFSSDGTTGQSTGTAVREVEARMDGRYRQYPRFIIPFMDEAEAHRFVQSWHRRELKLRMGGERKDDPSWEETRIINATILW
ncbi:hypothetical protein F5Y03DRAFT_170864 [Xylaria venustula]|nr:hypothetical protein F5Y03DRAFT_170864 [Xylaria venustula]